MAEEVPNCSKNSNQAKASSVPNYALLGWGSTGHGELGLGGIEEEHILLPRVIPSLRGVEVTGVTSGVNHTAFIVGNGVLMTCGSNDNGQLGHEKLNRKKPEAVDVLGSQITVSVDCGAQHTIAVTDTGQTFTWGSNSLGQLGRGRTDENLLRTPKLVKSLANHFVLSVTCGDSHNMILTNDGALFAWGSNSHGQLGLGQFSEKVDSPQQVKSLTGVPLSKLVAGANHSLTLTVSGSLFAWGKNSFGQLGIGDQLDRFHPTLVKTLRYQHLKHIDAGEDHSIGLTEDGGVFTFGAGSHGQLGHNSTNNELLPRKVFELMGSVVTQTAAGRRHSIAYVPASDRTYIFGLGGSGQLGTGQLNNSCSPKPVKGYSLSNHNSCDCPGPELPNDSGRTFVPCRIFAGGDRSFCTVTLSKLNRPPDDMRALDPRYQIRTVNSEFIDSLVSVPPSLRPSLDLLEDVEKVLSSRCCVNASFLLPNNGHYGCNSKNHGVDLDVAEDGFNRLRTLPNNCLSQKVLQVVEKSLIAELPTNLPDMEAMRVFLILPCCHLFDRPEYYATVHCPFAKTVTSLDKIPAKVLDMWWKMIPTDNFKRMIKMYKNTVVHMLSLAAPLNDREILNRQKCLKDCMDMLKKLHHVNQDSGSRVSYETFYIPELKDKLDIRADYINWLQLSQRPTGQLLSFCDYPFVFDGQAKTLLLQTDAMLQMQVAIDEVVRRNITSLIIPEIDPVNPCLILYVTRNNILQDTIAQLSKQGIHNYKKPLKVIFLGEEAEDAGGVVKEFFLLIMRELLDPKYGMFQYFEDSRLVWFNPETFEGPEMFRLVGLVCGLAIYNTIIIDLTFPLALFKKLLDKPVTLDDLCDLKPGVGRSMKDLLEYEGDDLEDTYCVTFEVTREVYGNTQQVELVPGGRDIAVTRENREEYVDRYIDYTFNLSTREQFDAFSDGFHKVCGGRVLALFHPQELQAMVVGNENYEWDELEKNCEYKGGYHREHQNIKFFWQVFREMTLEDKKKFLRFLTGSDRIPIHGMNAIKMFIQPTGGGESYLPVAHTCFNLLDLPVYPTRRKLAEKLLLAIQHTEGFGIV